MWLSVVVVFFGCEKVKVDNLKIKGGKGKHTLI